MAFPNIKVALTKFTPDQCNEIYETAFSAVKMPDGTYTTKVEVIENGKVTSCTQTHGYATAALAKTAINLQTAAYIDSL